MVEFTPLDWSVLALYFVGIMGIGIYFWLRNRSADQFTVGDRSLPGWLCGLSIFATFLSSISYLALPGKSFVDNWNGFVFSLAIPFAAIIAVQFFVPLYRESKAVSAYALLETRFGLWARLFASGFYLLYQIARSGVVMYLMALPMAILFGWDIRTLILITGVIVTTYSLMGGILAVIWADATQAVVLLIGAFVALGILIAGIPGGFTGVFEIAQPTQKFSLGDTTFLSISEPTIWVVLTFGIFDNLRNFGIDQSYIQRYLSAKDVSEARRSVWLGALLYVPVSAVFFFIGTALYAFYTSDPAQLDEIRNVVARQELLQSGISPDTADFDNQIQQAKNDLKATDIGDQVFPYFIASQMPIGLRGLLVAAIFAAAMSTVSTSLNSSATLVMSDFHERLFRKSASDREKLFVLRGSTMLWGTFGTIMALILVESTASVLDVWWTLSSVLGAGIIGLFLLGQVVPSVHGSRAIFAFFCGMVLIVWMGISPTDYWPENWESYQSPCHRFLAIVFGPLLMLFVGKILAKGKKS